MDVRQIEAYHAVMIYGTTSRAADVLSISQPAVSKAVQALERVIGFRLFDREKGRMVPTAEGQLFFREVQDTFAGLARLRSAAARIRDHGSGDLKVACLPAFSTNLLPDAIERFCSRNPSTAVSLLVASSSTIRDLVACNQIDIAVTADEVDIVGVEAIPFAQIPGQIALPPGHALSERDEVAPADLDGLPFIALAPEDTTRREAEAIFAQCGVAPRIVVETAYSQTICALVLAGIGCGIVDPVTAAGYRERGLILKPMQPPVTFRTLVLFPPKKKSRLTLAMENALLEELAMTV